MSKVEVFDQVDVHISSGSEPIAIVADYEIEVIQTLDEGPPGQEGPEGPPGPAGSRGPQGPEGPKGDTIHYGARDPLITDGSAGDSWINTATNTLFGPKSAVDDVWPAGVSLIGPQGPQGDQGVIGPQGPQGEKGDRGDQGIQGQPGEVPEAPLDSKTYGRLNANWVEVSGGGAAILVATDPPAGAADNSLWWESDTGITYLRYFDGTSRQWVAITESGLVGAVRFDAAQTLSPAQQVQARINIGSPFFAPQGRLTLQSGVPVMVTTQASKNTMFYAPEVGGLVPLFNGSVLVARPFTELSVLASDTTKNPSPIGINKVNDWFLWDDAGTLRLSHGPDWVNDTSPSAGTALVRVSGIKVNAVAITNGPAAQRGTWVGTSRSDAAGNFSWIFGGSAVGGVSGFFGVWNAYNRRLVTSQTLDTTASYNSANGVLAPLLNSNLNRTNYVCGAQEDGFTGRVFASCNTSATSFGCVFVGYDSNTVASYGLNSPGTSYQTLCGCSGEYSVISAPGFHFMQALQLGTNGAAATFYGGTAGISTGMSWQGMM